MEEYNEDFRKDVTSSGIFEIRQKISEQSNRPINLNILVIGEQGVGKTAFINTLLNYVNNLVMKKFKCSERLFEGIRTSEIRSYSAVRRERGITINLTLIDTPGYGDALKISKWFELINNEIVSRVSSL